MQLFSWSEKIGAVSATQCKAPDREEGGVWGSAVQGRAGRRQSVLMVGGDRGSLGMQRNATQRT